MVERQCQDDAVRVGAADAGQRVPGRGRAGARGVEEPLQIDQGDDASVHLGESRDDARGARHGPHAAQARHLAHVLRLEAVPLGARLEGDDRILHTRSLPFFNRP